ncbi:M23 family metallopeptidase [Streptomyces hoynatensis]|uniref:M23 family metallopeptidase n=1 Tax=Streptomyces hoynatensis TaxID=1141874 RepID=A0A3A9YWG2_9ACTN|nr:M23 family metallopeptidase [Streptomyces hoynatensis]RKN39557.1 M23 family metallopeptidase [Streptomyces hoynatensis]
MPPSDGGHPAYFGPRPSDGEPYTEWNPSEDSLRPLRGRHRVVRQRGGTIARSRAVLGVGVIAAVGAGGMATANDDGAGSLPGMGAAADKLKAIQADIPVLGDLLSSPDSAAPDSVAPFTEAGLTATETAAGHADAGEALRARILQQADQQESAAAAAAVTTAVQAAEEDAAEQAAAAAEAERAAAEAERRARELRESYRLPLADFTLTAGYGDSGGMWQADHTGQDFAAPTGTPVKNVHTGTVKEAAWAGSYGYRVVVELEDGTELWYCHLSSMSVSAGQELTTGDQIGLVGSTGNSTGPHLHVEVRPGGGDPVDPLPWLRDKGLNV